MLTLIIANTHIMICIRAVCHSDSQLQILYIYKELTTFAGTPAIRNGAKMKKIFSIETDEILLDGELGLVPAQSDTAIDTVLFAQLESTVIDAGAANLTTNDVLVDEDGDGFIIIDGIAIPADIAQGEVEEIEPEAPPAPLSGGGSGQPFELGDIGPTIDITDLLPPTALLFPIPEVEELDPFAEVNDIPEVDIFPDDPVAPPSSTPGITPVEAVVEELGLPDGTNPDPSGVVETTGDLVIDTGDDALDTVVINDVDVTAGGTVEGVYGTLTVTVNPDGTYDWVYVLDDNTIDHPDAGSVGTDEGITDDFVVVVTDEDGDTATDTLVLGIVDDGPIAIDDDGGDVPEDTPVTVNVFEDDTPGADGVDPDAGVTLVDGSLSGTGDVTDNGDGTFTYDPGPGEEGVVTFDYVITDGDGDTSTATVTITLDPDSEPLIELSGGSVTETGLSDGSNPDPAGVTTDGVISLDTGNDTLETLVINGVDVTAGGTVTGDFGVLTVTANPDGTYDWVYDLSDNTDTHPDGTSTGTSEGITDIFDVVATDSDGDIVLSTSLMMARRPLMIRSIRLVKTLISWSMFWLTMAAAKILPVQTELIRLLWSLAHWPVQTRTVCSVF